MHLCISSSPICQAALGKVAPAHLFLYMALKSWLSSLQHTFETEIALCFYTHTRIFHFNLSYKNWEYKGIYLRAHSNISEYLISNSSLKLASLWCQFGTEGIAKRWGPTLVFCFCNTEQLWNNLLPTVQQLIIFLIMPPATLVQRQINSTGDDEVSSDLNLSDWNWICPLIWTMESWSQMSSLTEV